jgi:hypothetical protein
MMKVLFLSIVLITNSAIAQVAMNAGNVLGFNIVLNDSETFIVPDGKALFIKSVLFESPSDYGELRINSKSVILNSAEDTFQNISVYAGQADLLRFVGSQNSISINGVLLSNETSSIQSEEGIETGFRVLQRNLTGENVIIERSNCNDSEMFFLRNLEGKELNSFLISGCRYNLNCDHLPSGTYIVGNGKSFLKIIISN